MHLGDYHYMYIYVYIFWPLISVAFIQNLPCLMSPPPQSDHNIKVDKNLASQSHVPAIDTGYFPLTLSLGNHAKN